AWKFPGPKRRANAGPGGFPSLRPRPRPGKRGKLPTPPHLGRPDEGCSTQDEASGCAVRLARRDRAGPAACRWLVAADGTGYSDTDETADPDHPATTDHTHERQDPERAAGGDAGAVPGERPGALLPGDGARQRQRRRGRGAGLPRAVRGRPVL